MMAAHRFGTFDCDLAANDTDDADEVETTESELEWRRLPLCFVQRRHFEPIETNEDKELSGFLDLRGLLSRAKRNSVLNCCTQPKNDLKNAFQVSGRFHRFTQSQ